MVWEGGRDRLPSRIGYQGLVIIKDKTIISRYVEYILHACTHMWKERSFMHFPPFKRKAYRMYHLAAAHS